MYIYFHNLQTELVLKIFCTNNLQQLAMCNWLGHWLLPTTSSIMATGSETESDISQLRTQLTIARNEIHNLRCETV